MEIPADGIVLSASELTTDESAMTGETGNIKIPRISRKLILIILLIYSLRNNLVLEKSSNLIVFLICLFCNRSYQEVANVGVHIDP